MNSLSTDPSEEEVPVFDLSCSSSTADSKENEPAVDSFVEEQKPHHQFLLPQVKKKEI